MKMILVVGNVVNGLRFLGPFLNAEDAIRYAEEFVVDQWNVANLEEEIPHESLPD